MDLIKLGEMLKTIRKELDLSLRDASNKIGISHNYLSILEKAKDPRSNAPIKPTIDTIKLISEAYNIDINLLLKLSGYDIYIRNIDDKEFYQNNNTDKIEKNETKAYHNLDIGGLSNEDIAKVEEYIELLKQKYNPDGTLKKK